jgi:tol-pal system protein YbgF
MNTRKTLSFRLPILILTFASALTLTGCLKTRAQLKDDPDESGKAVPAQVQDVQPQGQYVIDEMKNEMTRLNGRIEDVERAQKQGGDANSPGQKDELKKLEVRMADLEKAQAEMIEALKKVQDGAPVASNTEALDKAKAKYDSGDFEGAIQGFDAYLKNPKAKKSEEATWFRAESYFNLKEYKKAIIDYSKITEHFPNSKLLPVTLYKIGISFDALGMHDDAKGFYQDLVEKFPKSAEAKKAKSKLK